MDLTLSKAWELLDRILHNKEYWAFDLGSEGELKLNMIVFVLLNKLVK
jgi:hypothetical protein